MSSPDLEAVMQLQELDTQLDQARYRRAHLPERADLVSVQAEIDRISRLLGEASSELQAIVKTQTEVEGELSVTEARMVELEARFYSGTVTASRDLMAITEEIESLKRRKSQLEDRVLETMTEREPLDSNVVGLQSSLDTLGEQSTRLSAALASAEAAVDADLLTIERARAEARTAVPQSLATQYEKLREHLGGVGAARLNGASCSGCHLTLPATELERARKAGEGTVLTCEQCGRILVP